MKRNILVSRGDTSDFWETVWSAISSCHTGQWSSYADAWVKSIFLLNEIDVEMELTPNSRGQGSLSVAESTVAHHTCRRRWTAAAIPCDERACLGKKTFRIFESTSVRRRSSRLATLVVERFCKTVDEGVMFHAFILPRCLVSSTIGTSWPRIVTRPANRRPSRRPDSPRSHTSRRPERPSISVAPPCPARTSASAV